MINVEPESPNAIGHCVAVVASPRRVRFFDPNGGVLEFQDRPSFRRWFENYFGTISYYGDSGTMLQVINYHYDYAEEEPV
ncbi:YopT-type cysteine protease domain-containing protein [Paraburkholderia sp. EG304]|uniref:YopT-type cysteine protease domain-containing protein n=1 Tax=Paraburkholderia sp. EG304 TaxID=3237015 RepID=UPI00397B1C1E